MFAFQFESLLAAITDRIHQLADPQANEPPGGREITGHKKLDRALSILLRIRQEAALLLGDRQPQRGGRALWKDEFYFALAVYGLSTAKFDYKEAETAFALVSAGVAAAHVETMRKDAESLLAPPKPEAHKRLLRSQYPYPCYRVPLAHAHALWKAKRTPARLNQALDTLGQAAERFKHAVPLLQEYALLLAEAGQHHKALDVLSQFEDLCRVFHDEETLSRIGRTCKNQGDLALVDNPVPVHELQGHPAWQWYDAALKRYREAYDISGKYYPVVNAATLALILGLQHESKSLAMQALTACHQQDLSRLSSDDRFWVLVSEGEASLLLGKTQDACSYYQQALSILQPQHRGMMQSAYNQVCRLAWALGKTVCPVVEIFRQGPFRPDPGPLGDCVALTRPETPPARPRE
jgi:tetratricopeptide (TPR) repeat protein